MSRRPAPLADYAAKRDFRITTEPAPGPVTAPEPTAPEHARSGRFVVQKHAATRLHFDLRLEIDGVLKSWALTRGPSLQPGDRRLAVRTEDHPLAYADFEGTIPRGAYGGGTMMLWDEGRYSVEGPTASQALQQGKLRLRLHGQRLSGSWALVRAGSSHANARERWLFLKLDEPGGPAPFDIEARHVTSIRTGRTMHMIGAGEPGRSAPSARSAPSPRSAAGLPPFAPFQLCGRVALPPDGADWLHEIKQDGYRAQVALGGGRCAIRLRSGSDATDRLPALASAFTALAGQNHLLDGELVVQDAKGRSRFGLLQSALADGNDSPILFVAFDLLVSAGQDIRTHPLHARKAALKALLDGFDGPLLYSDHVEGGGAGLFAEACRIDLEGIVSKRAQSAYVGRRTDDWLKVKCRRSKRLLVVGWLPSPSRAGFRSLLLAERRGRTLHYAGKVGTGFSVREMLAISDRLRAIETDKPPVSVPPAAARGVRWAHPQLEAEVGYAEITAEGVLRHSVWMGFVPDEKPAQPRPRPPAADPETPATAPRISNRDRILFPETGHRKGDLADYMLAMAPHILVHAARRPLSLVRCPQGIGGECFFQKHAGAGFDGVRQTRADARGQRWIHVDDAAGLLACVQMGSVEFHGWGSRVGALDRPDRLVLDLDPDEGLPFRASIDAALQIRDLLADMGLVSFPMLSGGKGIHIVVPLDAGSRWPAVKDFARRFAQALEAAEPDRYVATARKSGRTGRIFIDWMRNQKGATAVLPWTVRARPGAGIAAPLNWAELPLARSADIWTLADLAALRTRAAELSGWGLADQALPDL